MISLVMLVPLGLSAQNAAVDKLFDKYSGQEGFSTVYISSYMFDMFRNMENKRQGESDEEFNNLISKLKGIKIISQEDPGMNGVDFYAEISKELPSGQFRELMVIKEGKQTVKFLAREINGKITELLMISGGAGENALISITGDIDLRTISSLSRSMHIEGLENLDELNEK